MDGLISLILKEGNVPPFMYDFLAILLCDFLNVNIALICAVGVFTNVANVLQQDVNDEEFIIVICQSGTIFTLAGENSNKIRLGASPLCSFFAKQMVPMNMNVASGHQKHSFIQEVSTESTQDGGVLESRDEELPVGEASTESTQDVGVPEELQVVEASTESTQDVGVLESRDEESPVVEASTELTQDGVDTNKSNKNSPTLLKRQTLMEMHLSLQLIQRTILIVLL